MTYLNLPSTYSINHGISGTIGSSQSIYPTAYQEYKQIQKSQYSSNPNYSKEINNLNPKKHIPTTPISTLGTKTNEILNYK